jgi:hypothetical protein
MVAWEMLRLAEQRLTGGAPVQTDWSESEGPTTSRGQTE